MEPKRPTLTIAIPTRNRMCYVKESIRSILCIRSQDLELVVEDNSDSDELRSWITATISDGRLKYSYSPDPVSMSENYERAMARVSGEFVSFIGDDDGVTEEIVAAAMWAKMRDLDAIVPSSVINYVWPDLHMTGRGVVQAGELRVFKFSGQKTFPACEEEMRKCARDAAQSFHRLPKAYYGIVSTTCMGRVKAKTGAYFPGVSPDMSAALAIASCAREVCYIDYPLFVPGSSARSNAGLSGLNRHIGRLRDQAHLAADCEQKWSRLVPCFYSVQTIWAEAAVGALRAIGRDDLLKSFNIPKLLALCYIHHPRYVGWRDLQRARHEVGFGVMSGALLVAWYVAEWWWLRCWRYLKRKVVKPPGAVHSEVGISDIGGAVDAVNAFLRKRGMKFEPNKDEQ